MKMRYLLPLLAFGCLQATSSFATDPAFSSPHAPAGLWIPGNDNSTYFGSSVAMSEDGTTVVVGAPGESAAYVYVKPAEGWQTTQKYAAKLTSGRLGIAFGDGVAISGDTIVVSMNEGVRGAAFVFEKPEEGWRSTSNYEAMLSSTLPTPGNMEPIAIDGDTIVAGFVPTKNEMGVGVFVKPKGGWKSGTETAILTASSLQPYQIFGGSIAISDDTIIVGGYQEDGINAAGSAFIYVKPSGGWANSVETADLTPSDGFPWMGFGITVSIDGETAVVGAWENNRGTGAVYVFTRPSSGWNSMTETAKLTASISDFNSWFGYTVAIRGRIVAVGAEQQGPGASYLYVEPTGGWQTTSDFNEELRTPTGLYVSGPFGMGGALLVTATHRETIASADPSVVLVYGTQ